MIVKSRLCSALTIDTDYFRRSIYLKLNVNRPKTKSVVTRVIFVVLTLLGWHIQAAENKLVSSESLFEPSYKGQPLSHWVEILNGGYTSSRSFPDINEIEGGTEAQ